MTEIHFDFNSLFIILLILLIGRYLYYKIYKLKREINEIQYKLNEQSMNHEVMSMDAHDVNMASRKIVGDRVNENIPPTIDPEWSHIHQQMNRQGAEDNDVVESRPSRSSGSSGSSRSSSSSKSSRSSKKYDRKDSATPENNSANIDEILAGKNIITDDSLSDILNVDRDLTKIDEFINTIKDNESTKIISTDYDKMTVSQLKKILSDKDLPISGNKTKLIERIKENSA